MAVNVSIGELNSLLKKTIHENLEGPWWVRGEISEISANQGGHCYFELVEKSEGLQTITARMRGTIWAYTFRMLRPYFETTTGLNLTAGLKVLVKATLVYHELYGLSINVLDIDPSFTMGEVALQRQRTINQLTEEGILYLNQELQFPTVPQHIAIISSATAAGYGDFVNQLQTNQFGFNFKYELYEALMQGNDADRSIVNALERIYASGKTYDVVVLIRGGGSKTDLACFDTYLLASHIALYPIPILTGIGHERDDSIADLVAHHKLKTPTAVAEYLIGCANEYYNSIEDCWKRILKHATQYVVQQKIELTQFAKDINHNTQLILAQNTNAISSMQRDLKQLPRYIIQQQIVKVENYGRLMLSTAQNKIKNEQTRVNDYTSKLKVGYQNKLKSELEGLNRIENILEILNPKNILNRGYSITRQNGKILKNASEISQGATIETTLWDGKIISKVEKTEKDIDTIAN